MGMGFPCRKNHKMPGAHKIGAAISGPELRAEILWTARFFGERKKPINIKKFGGTRPGVRPVCPGDRSHLSCDMSHLSRGHSVPLALIYT